MKITKKFSALLLTFLTLISSVQIAFCTFAAEIQPAVIENGVSNVGTDSIGDSSPIGQIVQNLSETQNNVDYGVFDIVSKAQVPVFNVKYRCKYECRLIVAVYFDYTNVSSLKMIGYSEKTVDPKLNECTVTVDIVELPQNYVVKGFMLDAENKSLCEEYTDIRHTAEFADFLEVEPTNDEFSDSEIIIFEQAQSLDGSSEDESTQRTDFAALNETVIVDSSLNLNYTVSKNSEDENVYFY